MPLKLLFHNQGRGRPIGGGDAPVVIPWYLAGNIPAANCLAAFKPKGAASYAASKVNIITPGTNDATDGVAYPTWASATGWTFTAASSQYLTVGTGAIKAATPLSMVCRFNPDAVDAGYVLMEISDAAANQVFSLQASGGTGGDPIIFYGADIPAGPGASTTTTGFTAGNWFTAAGVSSAANSRASYIDGGSKGTSAAVITPLGLDTTYIGRGWWAGGASGYLKGKIAACAFYDIALSDAQVLALHTAMAAL